MKIIAVVNNKGGVGKTTTSRLLAEYFSIIKNERVLAVDMDPQANFSNRYLKMEIDPYESEGRVPPLHADYDPNCPEDASWEGRSTIAGIYFGEPIFPYPTFIKTLDICPSHSSKLLLAERVRREDVIDKVYNQVQKFFALEEVRSSYDTVIIDTPPSKGPVTISAVRAATHLLIPSIMEPQPIEGIYGMMHLWKSESVRRSKSNPLNLIGVLPNSFDARGIVHKDHYNSLKREMSDFVLDSKIGRRLIYAETDAVGASIPSIFFQPEKSVARREIILACEEIFRRIG